MVLPSISVNGNSLLNLENYSKIVMRATGWIFRFIYNLRNETDTKHGPLTGLTFMASEIKNTKLRWPVSKKSKIIN